MCAEAQLQEVKRPWLVATDAACCFVGFFGLANGLGQLNPVMMGLGVLAAITGAAGVMVAKD